MKSEKEVRKVAMFLNIQILSFKFPWAIKTSFSRKQQFRTNSFLAFFPEL